ncbi:hypothetical protein [Planktotalea sp.]|uniref:hypothetical protein n=1 Tax=Planktotalea sp. TaxID=2029877 RepID=UPI0032969E30
MDRRTFHKGLVGGAVAAGLPIPSAAAATKPVTSSLYTWAVAIARAQNRVSPELLTRQLRISQAAATELYASLISNGVVRAPMFGGIARAVEPLFKHGRFRVVQPSIRASTEHSLEDLKGKLDAALEDDAPEEETDASLDQAT